MPFTAQTRMSGVDIGERRIRKGAADAIEAWSRQQGKALDRQRARASSTTIARKGATPLRGRGGGRACSA